VEDSYIHPQKVPRCHYLSELVGEGELLFRHPVAGEKVLLLIHPPQVLEPLRSHCLGWELGRISAESLPVKSGSDSGPHRGKSLFC